MNLTTLSKKIYSANVAKGFYENPTSVGERLALIHSEVSECLEADRSGKMHPTQKPEMIMASEDAVFPSLFLEHIKDTGADELADVIIRCLDFAAHEGIDIDGHIAAKIRYNATRPHKHGKNY